MKLEKVSQLLHNGEMILKKYDDNFIQPEATFIHHFDRYIFQTLEEIYEARDASNTEFLEEVADIANYTATMIAVLRLNLNINPRWTMDENFIIERDLELEPMYIDLCKKKLAYIYDDLISMRRRFPQRKWHKKEKMDNFKTALEECLTICLETISALCGLIGFSNLLEIALKKQEFILGLKPVMSKEESFINQIN